jgi:hypothetical protein
MTAYPKYSGTDEIMAESFVRVVPASHVVLAASDFILHASQSAGARVAVSSISAVLFTSPKSRAMRIVFRYSWFAECLKGAFRRFCGRAFQLGLVSKDGRCCQPLLDAPKRFGPWTWAWSDKIKGKLESLS